MNAIIEVEKEKKFSSRKNIGRKGAKEQIRHKRILIRLQFFFSQVQFLT